MRDARCPGRAVRCARRLARAERAPGTALRAFGWGPTWLVFALGLAWTPGCGDDTDGAEAPAPHLELGHGASEFQPLAEGEALPLVAGAQGGYHVWIAMRTQHLHPDRVQVTMDCLVLGVEGSEFTSFSRTNLQPDGQGWDVLPGYPARVLEPECAVGRTLVVDVLVMDRDGREVSASLEVPIAAGDLSFPPCEQ